MRKSECGSKPLLQCTTMMSTATSGLSTIPQMLELMDHRLFLVVAGEEVVE